MNEAEFVCWQLKSKEHDSLVKKRRETYIKQDDKKLNNCERMRKIK
jgi:hemerythrin